MADTIITCKDCGCAFDVSDGHGIGDCHHNLTLERRSLKRQIGNVQANLASKEAEIEALAQRCARMQKDRERLDWMCIRAATFGIHATGEMDLVWWDSKNAKYQRQEWIGPFREAIDAAIESERAAGEEA